MFLLEKQLDSFDKGVQSITNLHFRSYRNLKVFSCVLIYPSSLYTMLIDLLSINKMILVG